MHKVLINRLKAQVDFIRQKYVSNLSISLDTKGKTSPVGHKTPISDLIGCSCVEVFTCIMIDGWRGLIFININN